MPSLFGRMFPDLPPAAKKFVGGLSDGLSVAFGFHRVIRKLARQHFFVMGKPGSGKTILLLLFLQSIAESLRLDSKTPARAVVTDAKGDVPEILAGMGLTTETANIYDLNPYRVGAMWWNIARDITTPTDARSFARLLIPDEPNASAPFFAQSAQNCLTAVILALMALAPGMWTLRDVLQALVSLDRLTALLSQVPHALQVAQAHLDDKKHRDGILSTIHARLCSLEVLAALWDATPKSQAFSLQQFFDQPGILILGHDERNEAVLEPLTVLLLHFLTQRLLSSSAPEVAHNAPPHTYFVLDEFRGLVDGGACASLLNRGRSKGVCMFLGIQSVEGLLAKFEKNRLGQHAVEELLGMCGAKAFLALSGRSAEWAEKHFGTRRIWERSYGVSHSSSGSSSSTNSALHERALFSASSFTDNADPSRSGYFRVHTDVDGQFVVKYRAFAEVKENLPTPDMRFRGSLRPTSHQFMRIWSAAEENFYCPKNSGANSPARPAKKAPNLKPATRPDEKR